MVSRLTEAQIRQQLAAIEKERKVNDRLEAILEARNHLMAFTKLTMPDPEDPDDVTRSTYHEARFHSIIAKGLESVERGEVKQLIFCMPPRHGKTELATKRLAAWYIGRHPEQNVAVATYVEDLALSFGGDVRAIIASPAYKQIFPGVQLRRGGNAKDNLETTKGGKIAFVGRGGALTGKGAHLLLLDDLFKDFEDARSKATRDAVWKWFTSTAMSRRMGKKLVIITMTRWHSDDVIGRLTDPMNPEYKAKVAAKWKIIRLPALAEANDPMGREEGEALWPDGPDGFDEEYLQDYRDLDPMVFAALYQQTPSVADGTLFRRDNVIKYRPDQLPENLRIYCASDHSVATGQRNDPSCFLRVGIDDQENIWILNAWWKKAPTDEAVEAMIAMAGGTPASRPLIWWAEKGHISMSIGPFLRKRMLETNTWINIVEVTPSKDKVTRAQSIAARFAMSKVRFPGDAPWVEKAIDELLAFPNGLHDDFVDALSWVGLGLTSQTGPAVQQDTKVEPKFGTLAYCKQQDTLERAARKAKAGAF